MTFFSSIFGLINLCKMGMDIENLETLYVLIR